MSKNRSNAVRTNEGVETKVEAPTVTTEVVATTPAPEAPAPVVTAPVAAAAVTPESIAALIAKYGNKSNAIRAMSAEGMKCGPISKALGIRYQHARNVLSQPLKRVIKEEREAAKAVVEVAAAPAVTPTTETA